MRQLEAQKRQQELILRRKNEEVNQAVIKKANLKTRPGLNISSFFSPPPSCLQVTALRRQVRPVSGKANRKLSSPEFAQEASPRVPPGRPQTSGASPLNGARCAHLSHSTNQNSGDLTWSPLLSGAPQYGGEAFT